MTKVYFDLITLIFLSLFLSVEAIINLRLSTEIASLILGNLEKWCMTIPPKVSKSFSLKEELKCSLNCSIGIREHTIFPEIDYNSIDRIRGLQIVLVTTAKSDQEGMRFLELMGMPFVKVEDWGIGE